MSENCDSRFLKCVYGKFIFWSNLLYSDFSRIMCCIMYKPVRQPISQSLMSCMAVLFRWLPSSLLFTTSVLSIWFPESHSPSTDTVKTPVLWQMFSFLYPENIQGVSCWFRSWDKSLNSSEKRRCDVKESLFTFGLRGYLRHGEDAEWCAPV